ncbi:RNA-directed DNA polymerase, partial [Tanacetum coccineum]
MMTLTLLLYGRSVEINPSNNLSCRMAFFLKVIDTGFLFKGNRLCIPKCSLKESIIIEGHSGGLAGHFGIDKTVAWLSEHFYWQKMECDITRIVEKCRVCPIAKTRSRNAGLYQPLPVPVAPWVDTFDASQVARLFLHEVVRLHGVPKTITSGRELAILVGENPKQWDLVLPQAEFAYNRSKSRTTRKTPFEVVTGVNPITPFDLTPIVTHAHFSSEGEEQAKQVQQLHENVRARIEKQNAKYKEWVDKRQKKVVFKEGDLVWIQLGNNTVTEDPKSRSKQVKRPSHHLDGHADFGSIT